MRFPKKFIADTKDREKKIKKLLEAKRIDLEAIAKEKVELLWKINTGKLLYSNLDAADLWKSNYPDEKIFRIELALGEAGEQFYRYRVWHFGLKRDMMSFEDVFKKKPVPEKMLEKWVMKMNDYYNFKGLKRDTEHEYLMVLKKPWDQKSIAKDMTEFYEREFLKIEKNVFVSKAIYRDLTEEEFLLSNLPLKNLCVGFKGNRL